MKLEIKLDKKEFEKWCLEENLNPKNISTPLMYFNSKTLDKQTNETVKEMLKNISSVKMETKDGVLVYTLSESKESKEKEEKITDKDHKVFCELVKNIHILYNVPMPRTDVLLSNPEYLNAVMRETLGKEDIFNKLVEICIACEVALGIIKTLEKRGK